MKIVRLLTLLSILGLLSTTAWSQSYYEEDGRSRRGQEDLPPAGFWPTETMMDRIIDRISDDMGRAYNFDEDQLYNTRELFKERFPTWLNDNRAEIMQLTNEYLEALLSKEPPDVDSVADWAQRALPLFEDFTDLSEEVAEDMRPYLTENQQVILDGQLAGFRVGMSYMQQRVGRWSEGGYDADTEWPGNPEVHRAQERDDELIRQEMDDAGRIARGEPPIERADDTAALPDNAGSGAVSGGNTTAKPGAKPAATPPQPKDEWTTYVENFIRHYLLNDEQQARAYKYLHFAHEQRDQYLGRRSASLGQAKQAMSAAKTEEERAQARRIYDRLNQPLERMFTQLKEKLDKLPTRKQRSSATGTMEKSADQEKPVETATSAESEGAKRESPSSP